MTDTGAEKGATSSEHTCASLVETCVRSVASTESEQPIRLGAEVKLTDRRS